MKKYLALIGLIAFAVVFIACGDSPNTNSSEVLQNPDDTPTKAYERLYAAVKSKNTEAIRHEFSAKSQAMAQAQAVRSKIPVEEVYRNGFTRTTFANSLPEIRDERIKGVMGAVEVWNANDNTWEDLPFIREPSGWKLAIGDVFAGTWNSPGKGLDAREKEAANAAMPDKGLINGMANVNADRRTNSSSNVGGPR